MEFGKPRNLEVSPSQVLILCKIDCLSVCLLSFTLQSLIRQNIHQSVNIVGVPWRGISFFLSKKNEYSRDCIRRILRRQSCGKHLAYYDNYGSLFWNLGVSGINVSFQSSVSPCGNCPSPFKVRGGLWPPVRRIYDRAMMYWHMYVST